MAREEPPLKVFDIREIEVKHIQIQWVSIEAAKPP